MRVLRVIPDLQVGGVQRMLLRTLLALGPLGVDAEVACLAAEPGEMAPRFVEAGIAVRCFGFRSRLDPPALLRLRAHIRRGAFGVVHGHMYAANIAANIATIATPAAVVNGYHSESPFSGAGQARMALRTQRRVGAFVAVSRAVADTLEQTGLPRERLVVIHNGIDEVPPFQPPPASGPLRLVWAGRFVKQKRHDVMLEAFAQAVREGADAKLVLVGAGPTMEKARAQAQALGIAEHVTFAGQQADVRPFLLAAHAFLTCSEREGFSNALLEAVAAGRGVIASSIRAHAELLSGSGAGMLEELRAEAFARRISELAANPAAALAMGEAAHRLAARFTVAATAEKTAALYARLAASRST
jgi:glycosyltransferase involved in cell wall biosynthesis